MIFRFGGALLNSDPRALARVQRRNELLGAINRSPHWLRWDGGDSDPHGPNGDKKRPRAERLIGFWFRDAK